MLAIDTNAKLQQEAVQLVQPLFIHGVGATWGRSYNKAVESYNTFTADKRCRGVLLLSLHLASPHSCTVVAQLPTIFPSYKKKMLRHGC